MSPSRSGQKEQDREARGREEREGERDQHPAFLTVTARLVIHVQRGVMRGAGILPSGRLLTPRRTDR
jgi:hypothetical protein